jgi:hypothetical protein
MPLRRTWKARAFSLYLTKAKAKGAQAMGTKLSRRDFLRLYSSVAQGLFIFQNPKRMPKDQPTINVGLLLSDKLCSTPTDRRGLHLPSLLLAIVSAHAAATLTNYELLFSPSLHQDVVGTLLSVSRNRKLCIAWVGRIDGERLIYADENNPEHYDQDYTHYVDTYIIIE